ncbi:Cysteine desulfurase [hydrothermal vent metagenome]|uniref:Cysteine desulfurase n=1 Tax=hydrothermal vent metagenome TaxID=652676 RepID=A0A3B0TM04_9ZZZZ
MLNLVAEFDLPTDRVWVNAAHQGPLPRRAAKAVAEMVRWKTQPHHLASSAVFSDLPDRLRSELAALVGAQTSEIVLANSASYGLHLVANGLELGAGDEVIVAANDFPSDILPWTRLERYGVKVNALRPTGSVLSADEVAAAITPSTRVVCLTWVHSFSGQVIDLDAIGEVCRANDALFVVNGSQGIGGIPIAVTDHPIDALISVGHKWLCGPYATGFCWLGPRVADRIQPTKRYWLSGLSTDDVSRPDYDISAFSQSDTGKYDIFATANFFNFSAFAESVTLINSVGVDTIYEHNQALTGQLVAGIDASQYEVLDRGNPERLSSIVFLRPLDRSMEQTAKHLRQAKVDFALRVGLFRVSPHLYNTADDIDRVLAVLNGGAVG